MKAIYDQLIIWWDSHGTRILGITAGAVAAIQVIDPSILVDAIGARGVALLAVANALLVFWRGTVNAKNLGL